VTAELATAESVEPAADFDPENPPLQGGLTRRDLALAAWRTSRKAWTGRVAGSQPDDRQFHLWWDREESSIVKRGSLRLLAQAAWNASKPRASEYEPGDGFGRWWGLYVDEARLAHDGVAVA
jgi:hypothetical protein